MKKYIEPKITVVTLDPEQALLQVCIIGGAYFLGASCWVSGGTVANCPIAVKGVQNLMATNTSEADAKAS